MLTNLIGIKETAEYTGLQVSTIYKWVHTRQIPYYKVGRRVKFRKSEIEDWIQQKHVEQVNLDTTLQ